MADRIGSPLSKEPALIKIAEKHKVSEATALISYQIGRGVVVLPKSVTPSRIESNLNVVKLDQEDIDALNKLAEDGKQQRINSPPWGTDFVSSAQHQEMNELMGLRDSLIGMDPTTKTPQKTQSSSRARRGLLWPRCMDRVTVYIE